MERLFVICLLLFAAHWLCDWGYAVRPFMLKAKAEGRPWEPIMLHAALHGVAMFLVLVPFTGLAVAWIAAVFELATHFFIDTWKGSMNRWYPVFRDPSRIWHWHLFGFDQLLHAIVILVIAFNLPS